MEKGHSTGKKVFTIIGNVIIWLFVIFAAIVTIFTFAVQSSGDGAPSIGKTVILSVESNSMKPTFVQGDMIIGEKIPSDEKASLKEEDIITFDAGDLDGDGKRDLNTHRIKKIIVGEDGSVIYETQGDNSATREQVESENVICKYTGKKIAGIGAVLSFLKQPTGFLLVVVLPLILLFIYELIRFIRKFFELKGANATVTPEEEERIRQQAIEEYLRSQGEGAAEASEKVAEAVEAAPEAAEEVVEEAVSEAAEVVEEKPADE